MNNDSAELALSQARQHFRHLGIALPAKLSRELDAIEEATSTAVPAYDPSAVRRTVLAALAAGVDPAQDDAVRTALVGEHLRTLRVESMVAGEKAGRRAAVIRKHAAALIETMRPVVEAADKALVAARRELPTVSLINPTAVSMVPPSLMAIWSDARNALTHLTRVEAVWALIATSTQGVALDHRRKALCLADLGPGELAALPTNVPVAKALALAGHRLNLATLDEFTDRCARAKKAAAQAQERREAEARTGVKEQSRARHTEPSMAKSA